MDQTKYLKEQARITVEKMAQDIQDGNGNASGYIKWLLQDYFKSLYVAKGINGLREGLELYINFMENEEGLENFEFFIEEETATKKDYIEKLVLKIQQEVDKEEFEKMLVNQENNGNPIEYGVNYNEDILLELENWPCRITDDKSTISLYEQCIKEDYKCLQYYHKEQEKFTQLKEQVINRLAETIVDWSHFKFGKPRKHEKSIQIYTATRNEALRYHLDDYMTHKALHKKIRKLDSWGNPSMLEDEQAVVGGICNQEATEDYDKDDYLW